MPNMKKGMDKFDIEAEREGFAMQNSLRSVKPASKRQSKARNKTQRGVTKQTNAFVRKYIP